MRRAEVHRKTGETDVHITLVLDGTGQANIDSGIGFLDHMLTALTKHGRFDLDLKCQGDLHIDDHHTAEDCALTLGQALDLCLGERKGISRFGSSYAPLDEALARAVVDLSGRPFAGIDLKLERPVLGAIATENLTHFLESFAMAARSCFHVHVIKGANDHHRVEAAFKALALSLRQAVKPDGPADAVPSTKGVL